MKTTLQRGRTVYSRDPENRTAQGNRLIHVVSSAYLGFGNRACPALRKLTLTPPVIPQPA